MHDSYDYLIHLVRCAIHDHAPSELFDGAVFDSVYKCGTAHDIANLAYYSVEKLQKGPEADLLRRWESKRNSAILRDMNQDHARDELLSELGKQGISSVEVQGTVIKHLYPRPEYRTMSDMDLIVRPDDLGRAYAVLESLGYECSYFRDYDVNAYRDPNIHIEIHTAFFSDHPDYDAVMPDPFAEETVNGEVLYLYNVLHTAKHYFYAGCGIRRVLDMYYLNKNYRDAAKSEAVREVFEKLGITEFVRDISELAECWFGEEERQPDVRLSEMIDIIKKAGVHGTERQKLKGTLERDKAAGKGNAKARYVLRRLFPEKWVMVENYPVLKKAPVLYPFCWVHRAFRAITGNRRRIASEIRDLRDPHTK